MDWVDVLIIGCMIIFGIGFAFAISELTGITDYLIAQI